MCKTPPRKASYHAGGAVNFYSLLAIVGYVNYGDIGYERSPSYVWAKLVMLQVYIVFNFKPDPLTVSKDEYAGKLKLMRRARLNSLSSRPSILNRKLRQRKYVRW